MTMLNKKFKPLSREEAKKVLGGVRDPNDPLCPMGTHEYICAQSNNLQSGIGGGQITYLRYCVQDGQPNPPCGGLS